jgi:hypothetical protein
MVLAPVVTVPLAALIAGTRARVTGRFLRRVSTSVPS